MKSAQSSALSYEDLVAKNLTLEQGNARLEQELELYKFQLDQLKQYIHGRRSEKQHEVSPRQGNLFSSEEIPELEPDEEGIEVKPHKRKRKSKKSIPKDLPVVTEVYEPELSNCSDCEAELKEFSRDTREEIEFQPARFFRRLHVTVHCSCPKCNRVESGKTPVENKPVIPGAQFGAGFFAHLITSRICDHLPYYRQSQMYEREGLYIPDKSLSRYGLALGALLEPVAKEIKRKLLELNYLQADETRIEVLDKAKSPNTHRGQIWVLNNPLGKLTYFEYHEGRSQGAADSMLGSFGGTLQSDAYVCYDKYQGVSLGCLTHARRYFVKAQKLAKKECGNVLRLIGELYRIEKKLKKELGSSSADDEWFEMRRAVRQERSKDILEKLRLYLLKLKDLWLLEKHPMYTAIHYMLNRFESFGGYCADGRFEIDNNKIEQLIRPIAVGRRNWLFAGSHHGARMSAVMMTIITCCKQNKINPQRYLSDVLPRLAQTETTSVQGLSPHDWVQTESAN